MPSTPTTRNRFEKQAPGENANTWGAALNQNTIDLIDAAIDGRVSFALSGSKTLTSLNFQADEARRRFIDVTGGIGGTLTIPAVEKLYFVRNNSTGTVTVTTGSGDAATVLTGLTGWVATDGTNVFGDSGASTAFGFAQAAAQSAIAAATSATAAAASSVTAGGHATVASNHATAAALSAQEAALFDGDAAYFYAFTA